MEFIYKLNQTDLDRYRVIAWSRLGSLWRPILYIESFAWYTLITIATISVLAISETTLITAYIGGLFTAFFYLFCVRYVQSWTQRNTYAPDGIYFWEKRVHYDEEALTATSGNNVCRYSWRDFTDVGSDKEIIVLWMDRAYGIIIPARVFADEAACKQFVEFARARIAAASACQ